jgi:hypothetical protein
LLRTNSFYHKGNIKKEKVLHVDTCNLENIFFLISLAVARVPPSKSQILQRADIFKYMPLASVSLQ